MADQNRKTLRDCLHEYLGDDPAVEKSDEWFSTVDLDREWKTTEQDRMAAWKLFTEMRTRIVAQRLPYRKGDEETALKSLYSLFQICRDILNDAGPDARNFAVLADAFLNNILRPFTAEWHGRQVRNRFVTGDDRHDFRIELEKLRQTAVLPFYTLVGTLSGALEPDAATPAETSTADQYLARIEDREREAIHVEVDRAIPFDAMLIHNDPDTEQRHHGRRDALRADPSELLAAERAEIKKRRAAVNGNTNDGTGEDDGVTDLAGLAISGGGIRSATFSLGVLQGLAAAGILSDFDYLSTVSGGGYTGSFISSYFSGAGCCRSFDRTAPNDRGIPATISDSSAETPEGRAHDARESPAAANEFVSLDGRTGKPPFAATPEGSEARAIRHIRNHSSYLLTGGVWGRLTMAGVALYGLFTNILFVGSVLILLAWATGFGGSGATLRSLRQTATPPDILNVGSMFVSGSHNGWWFVLTVLSVFVVLLPLVQRCFRGAAPGTFGYRARGFWIKSSVIAFLAFCVLSAILVVPWVAWQLHHRVFSVFGSRLWCLSLAATVLFLSAALTAVFVHVRYAGKLLGLLTTLLGPAFLVFLYFAALDYQVVAQDFQNLAAEKWLAGFFPWRVTDHSLVLPLVSLFGLFYSVVLVNVNFASPHQFYRNRLSEAFQFAPRWTATDSASSAENIQMGTLKISQLRNQNPSLPFHIINTTVNLPSSKNPDLRGRGCDFFTFTPCYSGCAATGYYRTREFEELDRHLDLGTAIAVSGAAAAPHMGVGTMRPFQFLMTMLNVRLGYWLRNAGYPPFFGIRLLRGFYSRWGGPGATWITRELLGLMSERQRYLNISDGGHIENLGIYELLRRRSKFIVCLDGEASRDCVSLIQLIRYARTDFGISIDVDLSGFEYGENGHTQQHFALGRIHYPRINKETESHTGFLLFVKATVTGNEPRDLLYYQRHHPSFPTEPTADQFFDEQQFEAYRQLGQHIAEELLSRSGLDSVSESLTAASSESPQPKATVRTLFRELAGNVLGQCPVGIVPAAPAPGVEGGETR